MKKEEEEKEDKEQEEDVETAELQLWPDGLPKPASAYRCCYCRRKEWWTSGEHLYQCHGSTCVVAYCACRPCLTALLARLRAMGTGLSDSELLHKQASGQLKSQPDEKRIVKHFHVVVNELHSREGRLEEMEAQAKAARRDMMRSARARLDLRRNLMLKLYCSDKYSTLLGDYLSYYDDETKVWEYFGDVFNGRPHGVGCKIFMDGAEYYGEWVNGVEQTVKLPNSTITWSDGRKFVGTFNQGKMHGQGVMSWPDGSAYDGEYAHGQQHGFGKMTYPDGSCFEGRYRFGVRDGPGVETNKHGVRHKGVFKDKKELFLDDALSVELPSGDAPPLSSLLELSTTRLAVALSRDPNLHSASFLQHVLPVHRKRALAKEFLRSADDLSHEFQQIVPDIAWTSNTTCSCSGVRLRPRDLLMFIYFSETNTAIKELHMQRCSLVPQTVGQVCGTVLTHSASLTSVDLSWNKLGKLGAQALCAVLARPGCILKTVLVHGCSIGSVGTASVADMLAVNRSLTTLELPYNDIGAIGAEAIASSLSRNATLTALDLRSNRLGPNGGRALANGLLHNPHTLKLCKVTDNNFGEHVTALVAASLRSTPHNGLASFSVGHLSGPHSITGRFHLQREAEQRARIAATRKARNEREKAKEAAAAEGAPPTIEPQRASRLRNKATDKSTLKLLHMCL